MGHLRHYSTPGISENLAGDGVKIKVLLLYFAGKTTIYLYLSIYLLYPLCLLCLLCTLYVRLAAARDDVRPMPAEPSTSLFFLSSLLPLKDHSVLFNHQHNHVADSNREAVTAPPQPEVPQSCRCAQSRRAMELVHLATPGVGSVRLCNTRGIQGYSADWLLESASPAPSTASSPPT